MTAARKLVVFACLAGPCSPSLAKDQKPHRTTRATQQPQLTHHAQQVVQSDGPAPPPAQHAARAEHPAPQANQLAPSLAHPAARGLRQAPQPAQQPAGSAQELVPPSPLRPDHPQRAISAQDRVRAALGYPGYRVDGQEDPGAPPAAHRKHRARAAADPHKVHSRDNVADFLSDASANFLTAMRSGPDEPSGPLPARDAPHQHHFDFYSIKFRIRPRIGFRLPAMVSLRIVPELELSWTKKMAPHRDGFGD